MAALILAAAGVVSYFYIDAKANEHKHRELNIAGQPTLGNPHATVHVVLFEEPLCPSCKEFSETVVPVIKSTFAHTGRISFTAVPVSFLPHSMPLAEAWLSVYHQDPDQPDPALFFDFVSYCYTHQPTESQYLGEADIVALARGASSKINIELLIKSLRNNSWHEQVEENTRYGSKLLGGRLTTPSLFINGIMIRDNSLNNVITEIHHELSRHEPKDLKQ